MEQRNNLYDTDFQGWCAEQYIAVGNRDIENIDFDNLKEELVHLGNSSRYSLRSDIKMIMIHLLKLELQPFFSGIHAWKTALQNSRIYAADTLTAYPSLKGKLAECIRWGFERARQTVSEQTGIDMSKIRDKPFTIGEVLDDKR